MIQSDFIKIEQARIRDSGSNSSPARMIKILFAFLLIGCWCSALAAQTPAVSAKPGAAGNSSTGSNYRLGVGDVLRVIVARQSALSLDGVRIGNDGTIRLPMLDEDIPAVCQTEVELAGTIAEKYKKYLINPQVYVAVQEFNSNPVALIGAVNTPGRFDIRRPTRLLELLTFVNGPAPNAGKTIQIIRQSSAAGNYCRQNQREEVIPADEREEVLSLNLAETLKGSESANPFLRAGDIISINAADEPDEAFIIGNVRSATTIKLNEPVTLSKALAMAGGTTKDAKIKKIKISRQNPETLAKTEIIADLEEINQDRQKDILLQANDIVDVPGPKPSVLGNIFKRIIPIVTRGIIPFP